MIPQRIHSFLEFQYIFPTLTSYIAYFTPYISANITYTENNFSFTFLKFQYIFRILLHTLMHILFLYTGNYKTNFQQHDFYIKMFNIQRCDWLICPWLIDWMFVLMLWEKYSGSYTWSKGCLKKLTPVPIA